MSEFDCTFSLSEIKSVAQKLFLRFSEYKIWLFYGQMGSGKTTLIKSICNHLGVVDLVSSPTFSIVNQYVSSDNESVYHFDFYRIKHECEALDLGVDEYFDSKAFCLVEWPSMISSLLPKNALHITLEIIDKETRFIHCKIR